MYYITWVALTVLLILLTHLIHHKYIKNRIKSKRNNIIFMIISMLTIIIGGSIFSGELIAIILELEIWIIGKILIVIMSITLVILIWMVFMLILRAYDGRYSEKSLRFLAITYIVSTIIITLFIYFDIPYYLIKSNYNLEYIDIKETILGEKYKICIWNNIIVSDEASEIEKDEVVDKNASDNSIQYCYYSSIKNKWIPANINVDKKIHIQL